MIYFINLTQRGKDLVGLLYVMAKNRKPINQGIKDVLLLSLQFFHIKFYMNGLQCI